MDLGFLNFLFRIRILLAFSFFFGIVSAVLILFFGNRQLFLFFNNHLTTNSIISQMAIYFSMFGEWLPMLLVVLFAFWQSNRAGITGILVWVVGACFSWTFKWGIFAGKLRPFMQFDLENIPLNLVEGVEPHHYNTFPSGHTLTAFYAVFLLSFLVKNIKNWQMFFLWLLAFGCGLSRIILVQHWPNDVLGGMFLGIASALIVIWSSFRFPSLPILEGSFLKNNWPFFGSRK